MTDQAPDHQGEAGGATVLRRRPLFFAGAPGRVAVYACLVPLGIGLVLLGIRLLRCRTTELEVNAERAILRWGVLNRSESAVLLRDIRITRVERDLTQRFIGEAGNLGVGTAATNRLEIVILGIGDVEKVREVIETRRMHARDEGA